MFPTLALLFVSKVLALLLWVGTSSANDPDVMCPGYNYGYFQTLDGKWFNIVNSTCDIVSTCEASNRGLNNPCACSQHLCHEGKVNAVQVGNLWFECSTDPSAGACTINHNLGNQKPPNPVQLCCRNDRHRNLAERRINAHQYAEIGATNAMLETQRREYAEAVERRSSSSEIALLRAVHHRDLDQAVKRQEEAGKRPL